MANDKLTQRHSIKFVWRFLFTSFHSCAYYAVCRAIGGHGEDSIPPQYHNTTQQKELKNGLF
nr:MAG TPA: hypothetical protein [Caudoviricetes sp.]